MASTSAPANVINAASSSQLVSSTPSYGRFFASTTFSHATTSRRTFASDAAKNSKPEADAKPAEEVSDYQQSEASTQSAQELLAQLKEQEVAASKLTEQVAQLTDSLKRALAEMENVRGRAAREIETTKKFAVQSFAKSLMDVADTLERAIEAVPSDALDVKEGATPEAEAERLRKLVKSMREGVDITDRQLQQVFKKNGLEQYNPINQKFDPNLHNALFEVPDATKEVGTVAVVTKRGYLMHERVLRAAEVGVVRAP